jgi:hypothetical protein
MTPVILARPHRKGGYLTPPDYHTRELQVNAVSTLLRWIQLC